MLEVRGVGAGISKLGEAVLLVLLEHPAQEGACYTNRTIVETRGCFWFTLVILTKTLKGYLS